MHSIIRQVVGQSWAFILNDLSKCVVFGTFKDAFPLEIIRALDGLMVLGLPVGDKEYVSRKSDQF